jgi:hypothetical protein
MSVRSELATRFDTRGPDVYVVNAVSQTGRLGRAMGHYGCHELPTARNCIELMLYGSKSPPAWRSTTTCGMSTPRPMGPR